MGIEIWRAWRAGHHVRLPWVWGPTRPLLSDVSFTLTWVPSLHADADYVCDVLSALTIVLYRSSLACSSNYLPDLLFIAHTGDQQHLQALATACRLVLKSSATGTLPHQ